MFIEIPENTNLILNDSFIPDDLIREAFADLKTARVAFDIISAVDLTGSLARQLPLLPVWDRAKDPIVLFPGQGAKTVKKFLSGSERQFLGSIPQYNLPTARTFSGNSPVRVDIRIPPALVRQVKNRSVDAALIIDDVVATGQTVNTIKTGLIDSGTSWDYSDYDQGARFSYPKADFPRIEFFTACWMLQQSAKPELPVWACATYSKRTGKAPLNSLSTWLRPDQKSKQIRSAYEAKYFDQPGELIALLDYLLTLS